jgi:hypothetical protein
MKKQKNPKVDFYTREQIQEMESLLKNENVNINNITIQLAAKYGRSLNGIKYKLYNLYRKINSDTVNETNIVTTKIQPAEIGIEVPHGMTFEGKPKKIMLHSDHFRIYF